MPSLKKGTKRRAVKHVIPSYVCHATIRLRQRSDILNPQAMRNFAQALVSAVGMRNDGRPRVGLLPSGLPGIKAIALNQPLIESTLSIDTWPEKGRNGGMIVHLHTCKEIKRQSAEESAFRRTVAEFFPGSTIIQLDIDYKSCRI